MEIRTKGALLTIQSSPESSLPSLPPSHSQPSHPAPRKRVRRWHHRGFTGCSTCRRRHVRCDEASPACNNCVRLGLECDGTQGRMTFKVYGPTQTQEPPKAPGRPRKDTTSPESSGEPSSAGTTADKEDGNNDEGSEALVVSPITVAPPSIQIRFQKPLSPTNLIAASMQSTNERYFTHFIDQVSTLLIIYDNSMNANPYRSYFPDFARSSPSMVGAMQALGALHLANTSVGAQRNRHFQQAMGKYGEVVTLFRDRHAQPSQHLGMADFATCLLLCLFEVGALLSDLQSSFGTGL